MRLMLVWATAPTLPMSSVSTHMAVSVGSHTPWAAAAGKACTSSLRKAAKPAVFTTVLMKAVKKVGVPSYTSGVQKWNGAADTLKPMPSSIISMPM